MDVKEKRRYHEIDGLYTIGVILVLVGHSHSSDWSRFNGTILEKTIIFIYTFHMPLFFFIAGFLFWNSNSYCLKGFVNWIGDKAIRLLTPYFFWSLIAAVPKYYMENRSLIGIEKAIVHLVVNPRASIWGHFWFLHVLFMTYVLFGCARRFANDNKWYIGVCIIITLIIYFLPVQTNILGLADLHSTLVFFSFGIFINNVMKNRNYKISYFGRILWSMAVVPLCLVFIPFAYQNAVIGLLVAMMMISACLGISVLIPRRVVDWISNHSFTLYIFSWFFQAVIMVVCDRLQFRWPITFMWMLLAGGIGPAFVLLVYKHYSFLQVRSINLILGIG